MQPIIIEIPTEIAFQLNIPPKCAKEMLTEELVIRLYEQGSIASAHGEALLKMDRIIFEHFLAINRIAIHGEPDELNEDVRNLEQAL